MASGVGLALLSLEEELAGGVATRAPPPGNDLMAQAARLDPAAGLTSPGDQAARGRECACAPAWPRDRMRWREGAEMAQAPSRAAGWSARRSPPAPLGARARSPLCRGEVARRGQRGPRVPASPPPTHHVGVALERRLPAQVPRPAAVQADERAAAVVAGELAVCGEDGRSAGRRPLPPAAARPPGLVPAAGGRRPRR